MRKSLLLFLTTLCFCALTNKIAGQNWNISDQTSSGNDVTASLNQTDSTLIISGTGNMANFLYTMEWYGQAPWSYYELCSYIKTVVIESGVTNIGSMAFWNCNKLQWVTIPEGVTIIGAMAFENCTSLPAIPIPSTVTMIADRAFSNCTSLGSMVNLAETPQPVNANIFQGVSNLNSIYLAVPSQSIEIYENTEVWNNFIFTAPYVLFEENLGDTINAIIMGFNGSVYYYEYQDNNSELPKRLIIYDDLEDNAKIIIDYNNEGFPSKIASISDSLIILIDGYEETKCNVSIITHYGIYQHFDNVEFDITRDVSTNPWEWGNVTASAIGCALSVYELEIFTNLYNQIGCLGAVSNITKALGWGEFMPPPMSKSLLPIKIFKTFINCGTLFWQPYNPWLWTKCLIGVYSTGYAIYNLYFGNDNYFNTCSSWGLNGGTLLINGNDAFSCSPYPWNDRKSEITKLLICSGVTSIPDHAFSNCANIQSVEISNGNTPLEFGSSYNGTGTFSGSGIGSLHLGRQISYSGSSSSPFGNNTNLISVTMGNNVISISNNCFSGCSNLDSVTFSNNLTSIGNNAFSNCSKLKTPLNIPAGVTYIGSSAFSDCTKVPSLVITNPATSIGSNAFYNCDSLRTVSINAKIIPSTAFANIYTNRKNITSLTLGNAVDSIGSNAFSYQKLISLTIPGNVRYIGDHAFSNCTNIQSVTISDGNTPLEFGFSYNGTGTFSGSGIGSLHLGRQISYTGSNSPFGNNTNLTSVIMGSNITSLGNNCFSGCSNLTSVTFSNNLTLIGNNAFYHCSKLESPLNIPAGVAYIGSSAFSDCTKVPSLLITNPVTSIGGNAFNNCDSLRTVNIKRGTLNCTKKKLLLFCPIFA